MIAVNPQNRPHDHQCTAGKGMIAITVNLLYGHKSETSKGQIAITVNQQNGPHDHRCMAGEGLIVIAVNLYMATSLRLVKD